MKKSRKRKGTRGIEYFLDVRKNGGGFIYHDWLTISQLCALPECTVKVASMVGRLQAESKKFNTVWKCVTEPVCPKFAKPGPKSVVVTDTLYDLTMSLMVPCKYKPRIIGSR